MLDSPSIQKSRFFLPQPISDFVERRSLASKFEKLDTSPIMLVSASTGYGKSTLIANFFSQIDEKYAWLSLSEKENEFPQFITYFVKAIQLKVRSFGEEALKLTEAPTLPPDEDFADLLVNNLAELDHPFYLAIDDYHLINNIRIHQFISKLFEYPQLHFRIIIITRCDPELPMPEWISKNMLIEIRSTDLKFNQDEIAEFYEKSIDYRPDKSVLSKLEQATDGWVTGLRMLTYSTKGVEDLNEKVATFGYKNSQVLEQLVKIVLKNQTAAIRNKLLCLSLVKRFNLELFAELCLNQDEKKHKGVLFNEFVATITRSNMFLIAVDDDQVWYHFQHLFAEHVYKVLLEEYDEKRIDELRLRAADWFHRNHMHEEAIELNMNANRVLKALEIFTEYRIKLISESQLQLSLKLFKLFPQELIDKNGILMLTWGWLLLKDGKIPQMAKHIEPLELVLSQEAYPKGVLDALIGEVHTMKAFNRYLSNVDMQACLNHSKKAISLLKDQNPFALGLAWVLYGAVLQHMGQSTKARKDLYKELETCKSNILRGLLLIILSCLDWFDGDLTSMQKSAFHLLQLGIDTGLMNLVANGNILMGISFYHQNQDIKALEYLETAHELRHHTVQYMSFPAGMALANIYAKSGKKAKSDDLIQDYAKTASLESNNLFTKITKSASAEIAWRYQNDTSGLNWAKKNDCCDFLPFAYLYSPELVQAYILTIDDDPASHRKAQQILKSAISFFEARHDTNVLIRAYVIQAVLYHKLGLSDEANEMLGKVLDLSSVGHYIRPYLELGDSMVNLLQTYSKTTNNHFHIDEILRHYHLKAIPDGKVFLTLREKEILLLSEHMTNKELASHLFISDKTVKTHITNIYKKLEATNKREALIKAKELNLVSQSNQP